MSDLSTSKRKISFLLLIFAVCFINIFIGSVPLPLLAIILLAIHFVCLEKYDWAFTFCLYSTVFGAFFAQLGIRGVGSVLGLFGVVVLLIDVVRKRIRLQKSLILTVLLLLALLVSAATSFGGNYAWVKYNAMLINAFLYFIAFSHVYIYPEKHNGIVLSLILLIYSTFMLNYLSGILGGFSFSDIISIGSFRGDYTSIRDEDGDLFLYNYQRIGLDACMGFCLYFMNNQRKQGFIGWCIIIATALIVLCCQSRQSMLSFVVLIALLFTDLHGLKIRNMIVLGILILLVYLWIGSLNEAAASFIMGKDEFESTSLRSSIRQVAWSQFVDHPLFGVGFGRFIYEGGYGVNVHNMIFEILAETGIVGLIIFSFLSFNAIKSCNNIDLLGSNKWLFAFCITLFLRLMISSDLREGVEFFVLIFLMPVISQRINTQINISK